MNAFVERGGLWVLGQTALMVAVLVSALVWRHGWQSDFIFYSGVAVLTVAAVFGLLGLLALRRNLTPFPKPEPGATLVRHGIYGWVRHPLYSSVILAAVGWAMLRSSGPALALSLALALFLNAKAAREERWLRQQFPEYTDYARRVRRLIPWIY